MQGGNTNKTPNVEETPAPSESIHPQVGPSKVVVESNVPSGSSFQADLGNQLWRMNAIQLEGIPKRAKFTSMGPIPPPTEPIITRMQAPPLAKPIHRERTITPIVPLDTVAKSNTRPTSMVPMAIVGGGDLGRSFTPKNLEAPGKFFGLKHPVATPWLTKMSYWICLSKVLEDDLWDVVATCMTGVHLPRLMQSCMWRTNWEFDHGLHGKFCKALKAQFEPVSK